MKDLKGHIYYNEDYIEIEHYDPNKDIKWNEMSGVYFAPKDEGDIGFGDYKHSYKITPGTKIFKHYSSVDVLDELGYYDKYNKRLEKKYGEDARKNGVVINSYASLDEHSHILYNPNSNYMERQRAAIRIIIRKYNPQICHFTSEDELNPTQYVVLKHDSLVKEESDLKYLKSFENYKLNEVIMYQNGNYTNDEIMNWSIQDLVKFIMRVEEENDYDADEGRALHYASDLNHVLNKLKNFPVNTELYRYLYLPEDEKFNESDIGDCYVSDIKDMDDPFFQSIDQGYPDDDNGYVVKVEVNKNDIDFEQTLVQNLEYSLESEIRLKENSNPKIVWIKSILDDEFGTWFKN